nr:hypothetical protein [Tanacetum cinerariifolium]
GIIIKDHDEPSESRITTTTFSLKKSQDKGKAKLIEEPVKSKKKDQILLDKEVAKKLQDEINKKERLAGERARLEGERAQQEFKANIALIETWDDVQEKIDADYELAQRLQAEEQQELNDEEKATLFMQLLEKRRKFFAAKRAEEKRNRPPTKDQQRSVIIELVEESSKKAKAEVTEGSTSIDGEELEQEHAKKQKIDDDKETAELKQLVNIIPDKEGVAIDVIPLVVKPPSIVDWKFLK